MRDHRSSFFFFQELWYREDFNSVKKFARDFDYFPILRSYDGDRVGWRGAQILVDKSVVAKSAFPLTSQFTHYGDKTWWKNIPFVTDYHRGVLSLAIELRDGTSLLLANTHLTPMLWMYGIRRKQVASLVETLDDIAYIWIKENDIHDDGDEWSFAILDATLIFTKPIDGNTLFLSDHCGVLSEIALLSIEWKESCYHHKCLESMALAILERYFLFPKML